MPPNGERRPLDTDGATNHNTSPAPTIADPGRVARVLATAGRIELSARRALDVAAWHGRACYAAGYAAGRAAGYEAAEADQAAAWQAVAHPVAHADAWSRESAARRERAALGGEARDQAAHWREFAARALATPAAQRTSTQQATAMMLRRAGTGIRRGAA
jgi:hypothetical protein